MASRHVWFVLTGIMMLTTRRECVTAFTGVGSVRRHVDLDRMLTASRRVRSPLLPLPRIRIDSEWNSRGRGHGACCAKI